MLHTKFRENWPAGFGEDIWAWRPSWSCDPDATNKISFPLPKEAPHKIWLWLAKRFRRRRSLSIVNDYGRRLTTTDAGPWAYMWYILEPKSGDLEFLVGKFMSCIGRFSCCKFRTFFTEVKVAKSSDISRNVLQSITVSTYANRSENMCPFTV